MVVFFVTDILDALEEMEANLPLQLMRRRSKRAPFWRASMVLENMVCCSSYALVSSFRLTPTMVSHHYRAVSRTVSTTFFVRAESRPVRAWRSYPKGSMGEPQCMRVERGSHVKSLRPWSERHGFATCNSNMARELDAGDQFRSPEPSPLH